MALQNLQPFFETLVRDASFGLGILAFILLLSTFLFVRISLWFKNIRLSNRKSANMRLTFRFMMAVLLICLVQILCILLWTATIYLEGLITDPTLAMLFAGSCYTTLGIYSDILPHGWRALALYIAISGLFSFAIATSAMISMLGTFSTGPCHQGSYLR
jgi:hypothetical protein